MEESVVLTPKRPRRFFERGKNFCRLLDRSLITGGHVTTRKLQFAEKGPKLRVESYELPKTLRWCERLINSIGKFCVRDFCLCTKSDQK